jgi:hypothetical protein
MISFSRFLAITGTFAGLSLLLLSLCGCQPSGPDRAIPAPEETSDDAPGLLEADASPLRSLKDLGPSGRRVSVIVLPGDADVEVAGVVVRRRDGVVELMGQVGQALPLRVFKGDISIERSVTILDTGASPPLLDLAAGARPVVESPDETFE